MENSVKLGLSAFLFMSMVLYGKDAALADQPKQEAVSKDEPRHFKKVIFEPRVVYSQDKALCEALLQNHQKEFYKGSDRKDSQHEPFVELPWKSQLDDGHVSGIVELGKIDLTYGADNKRTLLRWIEPFSWRGEHHNAFFYPSSLEEVNFKELNATDLTALKAKGKAIYPDFNITDWNQSTYDAYATEWTDVKPFAFHDKYYFENNVNKYMDVGQKYITTFEILQDGKLKPTCVIQTKHDGKNPLRKLKNVGALLETLANMTGGYGSCGTLAAGDSLLILFIPSALEKVAYSPWKEVSKYQKMQVKTLDKFLQEWGYKGLWNYDVWTRYINVKEDAKEELKQYYIDTFGVDDTMAIKYADKAFFEILNAHFTFPVGGYGRQIYDDLQRALLEGKSEQEIKPLMVGNWQNPQIDLYGDELEATLFSALKTPKHVAFLIQAGADVNASNGFGKTALMYAAQYNLYETAEILIKSGIDVNKQTFRSDEACTNTIGTQGVTALHYAVRYADAKFIDLLVKNGANKNIKDSDEKLAFDWIDVFSKDNKYFSSDEVQHVKQLITPMSEDEKNKVIQNHVETARKAYRAKEYEKAASWYENALLYDNQNAIVLSDLALVYYRMGEYQKAAKAAFKNIYNDKATSEQKAAAHFNMGMICSITEIYFLYEGKGYCGSSPFNDYLAADVTRSTPDRAAKILEMLRDDYRPKVKHHHVLLESSDKKVKVINANPSVYLFSHTPLSNETQVAVTYKGGEKTVSPIGTLHEITYKNEHYYIYRTSYNISLGKDFDQKICYDKACKESSKLEIIVEKNN